MEKHLLKWTAGKTVLHPFSRRSRLVGAGAIGQAMLHAFAQMPITGKLVIVDPESISLSNLQRYVLAMDDDVGSRKCSLGQRTLIGSNIEVECVEAIWGEGPLNCAEVETVAVAPDTAAARIGVQAVRLARFLMRGHNRSSDVSQRIFLRTCHVVRC